jgi:hypothetical protein
VNVRLEDVAIRNDGDRVAGKAEKRSVNEQKKAEESFLCFSTSRPAAGV